MSDDLRQDRQIQVMRDLGLSRAEAEVYLACLNLADSGPLSSYRVAQDMGRDPANVGKIINALVRLQAVRIVQAKPRLFVAVVPEEFTEQLIGRMRRFGAEAVSLLDSIDTPAATGIAHPLTSPPQVFVRAREMLAACRHDVLVFGSPDTLRELSQDFESAAHKADCRVRLLSREALPSGGFSTSVLAPAGRVGDHPAENWLQMTVDDSMWLTALFMADGSQNGPCGWWSTGSGVARVLAEGLEAGWRSANVDPVPESSQSKPTTTPAPPRAAKPVPDPTANLEHPQAADEAAQAGFTFLFKHEKKTGRSGPD